MARSSKLNLTRDQSLGAKPVAVKISKREKLDGGGERVVVPYQPSKWQRFFLRTPETLTRSFDLDAFGVDVLNMCDGQKTVRYIAEAFAKRHKLNKHEAEKAVIAFLQTLISKGVVVVMVEKD